MAVPSGYAPAVYAGNDSTFVFPFAWPLLAASHLVVVHTDALGVETTLVNGTNFDMVWIGSGATGSIRRFRYSGLVKIDYPLAIGETLTLSRAVPVEQPLDLQRRGKLSTDALEMAYDRACMIAQQTITLLLDHADLHAPGGSSALPWGRIHGYGLLADRPTPDASLDGYLYFAYDVPALYRCDGVSWLRYTASEQPEAEVKTVSFTAIAGMRYIVNAAAAPIDISLPAGPGVNTYVGLIVSDASHTITVLRNGSKLVGDDLDLTLERAGDGVDLIYTGPALGWSPANELSVSQLDVPQTAADLPFAPASSIQAENTQAAIVEVAEDAADALAASDAANALSFATAAATTTAAIAAASAEAQENAIVSAMIFGG